VWGELILCVVIEHEKAIEHATEAAAPSQPASPPDSTPRTWAEVVSSAPPQPTISTSGSVEIKANITYSYDIVRNAALEIRALPKWRDNTKIGKLTFSNHWIHDFLSRNEFKRRKITREDKIIPPEIEVQAVMLEHQKLFYKHGYSLVMVNNMDETAFT
jgi:hypothetical protein